MQQPELVLHHSFSFQLPILLNVQSRQRPATRNKNRHSSALTGPPSTSDRKNEQLDEREASNYKRPFKDITTKTMNLFKITKKGEPARLSIVSAQTVISSSGQAFHIKMEFPLFECDVLLHSADNNTERWPLEE